MCVASRSFADRDREMASQSNDPRLPSAARPYKPPIIAPQDLPVDYSGFIAVVFGVFGAMFRVRNHFALSPIYVFPQYLHLIVILRCIDLNKVMIYRV